MNEAVRTAQAMDDKIKIVDPVYNGSGGCVGGNVGIRR